MHGNMGENRAPSYYDEVMDLSEREFYRLKLGYKRLKEPLLRFPNGVHINGYDVVRSTVKAEPVCRYLEEHHPRGAPQPNVVTETLGVLETVGAVKEVGPNGYSVEGFTEKDGVAVEDAIQYRRLVEEDPLLAARHPEDVMELYRKQQRSTKNLDDVFAL